MNRKSIRVERDGRGVATLTLARPEKHNALSAEMIAEISEAAGALAADATVRLVVLAADGASFCGGADLAWMKAQFEASRSGKIAEARRFAMMLQALNTLPKPLIGRVHGSVFGGGIGLVAACDVAIGAEEARSAFSEVRLGIIPATISPYVLARIGEAAARRTLLSGRTFDADEAHTMGLLASSVAAGGIDDAVEAEISAHLQAAPGAVATAKALVRCIGGAIDQAVVEDTIERLADAWESAEGREGVAAFFARRKPAWANASDRRRER